MLAPVNPENQTTEETPLAPADTWHEMAGLDAEHDEPVILHCRHAGIITSQTQVIAWKAGGAWFHHGGRLSHEWQPVAWKRLAPLPAV